jgi:hypothetical protein
MKFTIQWLLSASFEELKAAKIELRRAGRKASLRYANVSWAMRTRFGRD